MLSLLNNEYSVHEDTLDSLRVAPRLDGAPKDLEPVEVLGDVGIVPRKDGRKKVLSLTEQGCDGAIRACEYFCRAYGGIFEEFGSQEASLVQG